MTSTESTLLGIGIGALLTWISSAIQSRWQWHREEQRRTAERRAALYEETLVTMERMKRTWYRVSRSGQTGARPDDFADEKDEEVRSAWYARIRLYASSEVEVLWDKWANTAATREGERKAREALVERMRLEVGEARSARGLQLSRRARGLLRGSR